MKLSKRVIRTILVILFPAMVMPMASCGTLLYPERRHSNIQVDPGGRRVDPAVAVLDAVGLIFFVIPGIIAFAVDFGTGAIYCPKGKAQSNATTLEQQKRVVVHLIPDEIDKATLERIIGGEVGVSINFDDKRMQAFKINKNVPTDTLSAKLDKIVSTFNGHIYDDV